jgi:signal transduction histidine kinase
LAATAAAAHDLNDELTVILSSVAALKRELGPGHPAREKLIDLQAAAQRCAWTASGLLNFSARRGARPTAATFERMAEEDALR